MKSRKSIALLALGAAMLGGCATYDYYDPYARTTVYSDYPTYEYYSYGPRYYAAPSVQFGLSYSNRGRYWRGRPYG